MNKCPDNTFIYMTNRNEMKGKVLIAGGSGLVGTRLTQLLSEDGYEVIVLSRSKKGKKDNFSFASWDPEKQQIDDVAFSADHVINLAGAGIADQPWTDKRRKVLTDSRLISTNFLCEEFRKNGSTLKTYIGASAIGYYGDGGDSWQTEDQDPAYKSFMTELCNDWEQAHSKFTAITDRLSIFRIGVVLSTQGGAYPKMRLPFKVGVGTYFGSGKQYYSWIHIDDLARIFIYLINDDSNSGIYNAVTPNPLTNKDLTSTIKTALDISGIIVPAPAIALKLAMGQMSNVILNSNRVSAEKISQAGFEFNYPTAEKAIKDIEQRSI